MNGYKLTADSYRKAAKEGKITQEQADKDCRIFDFLAECDEGDFYRLFDSTAFNSIFKGYVQKIIDELCESDDDEQAEAAQKIRGAVIGKASGVLDRMNAKEAEKYYMSH